jgi:hypothetical protein
MPDTIKVGPGDKRLEIGEQVEVFVQSDAPPIQGDRKVRLWIKQDALRQQVFRVVGREWKEFERDDESDMSSFFTPVSRLRRKRRRREREQMR